MWRQQTAQCVTIILVARCSCIRIKKLVASFLYSEVRDTEKGACDIPRVLVGSY